MVLFRSSDIPISVANMVWTGEHRGFAVRAYFENNQSVIATQRAFRRRFNIPRNNAVPQANTIRSWVRQLEATGSTLRRDTHGRSLLDSLPFPAEACQADDYYGGACLVLGQSIPSQLHPGTVLCNL